MPMASGKLPPELKVATEGADEPPLPPHPQANTNSIQRHTATLFMASPPPETNCYFEGSFGYALERDPLFGTRPSRQGETVVA